MTARIAPLDRSHLAAAVAMLAESCAFDRADVVAEEKLFGLAPRLVASPRAEGTIIPQLPSPAGAASPSPRAEGTIIPQAFGAWLGDDLAGVAAVCGNRVRLIAVRPAHRGLGIGSALLAACETAARAAGIATLRAVDQPGNYLAPGIDERNVEAIAWLERRGWQRAAEPRVNVLIDVRDNPRVTAARVDDLARAATARGYEIRRARADEPALLAAVDAEFGGAWPFELARALAVGPPGVHVALRDGAYCGFAAHDGNNSGLGWFGPTGTWPAHRGNGLGEVLLLACLVDVARDHARCEVAWIGPRPFYEKVAGIAAERRFVAMSRTLT